jgi:hypothetical protein
MFATDYIQSLEDETDTYEPEERMLLRLNSVRPSFNYSGEYTIQQIRQTILPTIKRRYREAEERDSVNQVYYSQMQKNVAAIRQDIFEAEQAINEALSPETRDQDFRIWISMTFSGLIGVILISFFLIIYRRSDSLLYKQLLSGAGLQFVTVFVLIIAIILFGILKVLGGSELAAILSGISGYILGKGGGAVAEAVGRRKEEKSSPEESPENIIVDMDSPKDTIPDTPPPSERGVVEGQRPEPPTAASPETISMAEEGEDEEEKYFPGGEYK